MNIREKPNYYRCNPLRMIAIENLRLSANTMHVTCALLACLGRIGMWKKLKTYNSYVPTFRHFPSQPHPEPQNVTSSKSDAVVSANATSASTAVPASTAAVDKIVENFRLVPRLWCMGLSFSAQDLALKESPETEVFFSKFSPRYDEICLWQPF